MLIFVINPISMMVKANIPADRHDGIGDEETPLLPPAIGKAASILTHDMPEEGAISNKLNIYVHIQ